MFYVSFIMKKSLILFVAAAALAVAFSGCASTKKSRASKSNSSKESSAKAETKTSVKTPNPYTDYDSQEKAESAAGFKFNIPSSLPFSYSKKISRAIPSEMIEIIYTSADSAAYIDKVAKEGSSSSINNNANNSVQSGDEVRLRKAKGSDDISGDYTKYLITKNMAANLNKADSKRVELRGEVDNYHVATWVDGAYTYAITSKKGLTEKQILAFADQLY